MLCVGCLLLCTVDSSERFKCKNNCEREPKPSKLPPRKPEQWSEAVRGWWRQLSVGFSISAVESVYDNNLDFPDARIWALTVTATCRPCRALARCGGYRVPVLTTRVEQRQRFRQREGLKERSAVADTVEHGIYREQWTEGGSHINYRGSKLSPRTDWEPLTRVINLTIVTSTNTHIFGLNWSCYTVLNLNAQCDVDQKPISLALAMSCLATGTKKKKRIAFSRYIPSDGNGRMWKSQIDKNNLTRKKLSRFNLFID